MPFPVIVVGLVYIVAAVITLWWADQEKKKKEAKEEVKPLYDILDLWSHYALPGKPATDLAYASDQEKLIQAWAKAKGLPLSLYLPGKSPLTPREAELEAKRIIDKGMSLITILNTLGITAEVASVGQIESVIWGITNIINASGVPRITQDLYGVPMEIGVKIPLQRRMNTLYQPNIPDVRTLTSLRARGMITEASYDFWMREQGYPDWAGEMMAYAETRMPGFGDLLDLLRRGFITPSTFRSWIRKAGLHPDTVDPLTKLRWTLPGYMDIISIYMREGYLPEKWVEIPGEFIDYLAQMGYDSEWAKRLWGKHWILPSVDLLYEMFWKKIIDFNTMASMLKYHDYEPVWRQRLIENAYRMIPRVDVRRGYRYGMLHHKDLRERYEWLGYKPKDAEIMSGIAAREPLDRYYTAIETQARSLFREGLMTGEEFRGWLRKSGLPEEAIDLAVDAENLAYRHDYLRDLMALSVEAYRKDVYTLDDLEARLLAYGMQPERVAALTALETLRKLPKPRAG